MHDQDTKFTASFDEVLESADRLGDHLRLLQLLLGRARWDYESLARELECSDRTIRRRLAALELAGVPTFYDKELRCVRVLPGVKFPVLQLTREELLAQATTTAAAGAHGLGVATGGSVSEKLAATSPEEVGELLADAGRVMEALDLRLADHSKHQGILRTIQWALIEHRQIMGCYRTPYQNKPVELTLHPIRLCLTGQAWYLIARPVSGHAPKTYRVMRFQTARPLDAAAEVPENFDLDTYFGNAWNVFRGEETSGTPAAVLICCNSEHCSAVKTAVWGRRGVPGNGRPTGDLSIDYLMPLAPASASRDYWHERKASLLASKVVIHVDHESPVVSPIRAKPSK